MRACVYVFRKNTLTLAVVLLNVDKMQPTMTELRLGLVLVLRLRHSNTQLSSSTNQ